MTQNDAISPWLLFLRPRCSPWLLVTQHLSQSHNFQQNKSAISHTPRAPTTLQYFRTSTPEHFGTGIYLVASLLNHSCSPNCTVVFQGRQLSIVATKDVPSGIGSYFSLCQTTPHYIGRKDVCEVCYSIYLSTSIYTDFSFSGYIPNVAHITYVNSLDDTSTRQEQLSTTWHFLCDCSLCANKK